MAFHYARADRTASRSANAPARFGPRFEDVVKRYGPRVTTVAFRITQNLDDAQDVAQHVFLQMHVKRVYLGVPRSLERWLYVATRNEALNLHRRRRRDDATITFVDDEPPLGLEETVLQNERCRYVRDTIARLPAADRQVIELRHLQSMPTAEMALQLGVTVKRVKKDVERAKNRLRFELLRCGFDGEAL